MSHETVAENSKNLGKKYACEGNFGRAFSHYLVSLKLKPEWGAELNKEFSTVLCKWGTILERRERFNDLFTCYEQAVEVFPDDTVILNNLGAHLLRCGLLREAAHYFRKCLAIEPRFIRAAHNLENVSNLAVERWHFRMLNDQHRNEAYREAIIKKIRQGVDRVLDVGTGTGILSLFAAEGKAKEIYACESSPIMVEIAQQVFRSNNATVKLINKHSSELQIPEDVREKVPLLVTETFDAGLLGEDILDTLAHAWEHLLLPPQPHPGRVITPNEFGRVIPSGAFVYVTGIELEEFANDFHLKRTHDLFENCTVLRNSENYDTHDLSRGRFKSLTGTEQIFQLSFNDPKAIADVLKGNTVELSLKCKCSGRLDCFAVWFDLCLDEDIVLRTNPLSKDNSAWDQAIFPLPRSVTVEENQEISVVITYTNKKLNITPKDNFEDPKFEASEDVIKILNSEKQGKVLREAAENLSRGFGAAVTVLDCYPFPVFGFYFLMQRRDRFKDELICFVPTENDRGLVQYMAEQYGLEVEVMVNSESCFDDCLQEKRFDIILLDLVEVNGDIRDGILLQLDYLKSLLKPGGLLLPKQAAVIGQFIYSDWLWQASKVINDSVTCGYNIAEYINPYQVRHMLDLDLKSIEHTMSSQPFDLFSLFSPVEAVSERMVARCSDASYANALVYWIKIKVTETCEEILTYGDSCYHQAAILFSKVEFPEEIKFNIIRSDGLFNIELSKT